MAGRQLDFATKGERYEKAFDSLASGFLSIVRTPRGPDDYGIDAFCHVRIPLDEISTTVGGTFGVQVRGPGAGLRFGGANKGMWRSYEIQWLRSLAVPLYLARVSGDCGRVDLYSLWPIWIVLGQAREPFEIVCQFDEATEDPKVVGMRAAEISSANPGGDGKTWSVPIGPPFLSFTQDDMRRSQFVSGAGALMMNWLAIDRRNVIRALLGVAYVEGIKEWATNDFARKVVAIKQWMAWTDSPTSSKELASVLEPLIVNLGVHLQFQDDRAAYALIPTLELFGSLAVLSKMGSGLLEGLKRTHSAGVSPKQ